MKQVNLIKAAIVVTTIFLGIATANAQSATPVENNQEGFGTQLKKGTVPGMKFAPITTLQPKKDDSKTEPVNSIRQIKAGTAPGVRFANQLAAGIVTVKQSKGQQKLASDSQAVKTREPVIVKTVTPVQ